MSMEDVVALIDARAEPVKKRGPYMARESGMNRLPAFRKPDEEWCDMVASYSADELLAGGLIQPEQWDKAMAIIRQQAYVSLVSNCYPTGDLNSN